VDDRLHQRQHRLTVVVRAFVLRPVGEGSGHDEAAPRLPEQGRGARRGREVTTSPRPARGRTGAKGG
jgi:hypothetical protein